MVNTFWHIAALWVIIVLCLIGDVRDIGTRAKTGSLTLKKKTKTKNSVFIEPSSYFGQVAYGEQIGGWEKTGMQYIVGRGWASQWAQ